MKTIQNPTQYFFEQSNNPPTEYLEQINEFVGKLLNLRQCVLCKNDYNMKDRLPRILIHCGHTICHSCLLNFYRNRRVRCPLCLKLIKHLDNVERLPINHSIFTRMAEDINNKSKQHGGTDVLDPQQYLFAQFQSSSVQSQKNKQQQQQFQQPGMPMVDPESGLEFCEFHNDRVKHFFCMKHKVTCCRVCSEMIHQKKDCMPVDLYEIDDIPRFLQEAYCLGDEQQEGDTQQKTPHMNNGKDEFTGLFNDEAIYCKQIQKFKNKIQIDDEDGQVGDDDIDDSFDQGDGSLKSV